MFNKTKEFFDTVFRQTLLFESFIFQIQQIPLLTSAIFLRLNGGSLFKHVQRRAHDR